jgi:hypothetical protein
MTNTLNTVSPTTQTLAAPSVKIGSFGYGKYAKLKEEMFKDLQRSLGCNPTQAHLLAIDIATDYGRITAGGSVAMKDVKVGKFNDENRCNVREAANTVKNVIGTNALRLLRVLAYLNDASKFGVVEIGKVQIDSLIQDYVDSFENRSV